MSQAWSSVNSVTLVQLWRKLLQGLEEDYLLGFPNKEIRRSKILGMVCATRSLKNVEKSNAVE
jgi:hypothetical protein